MSCWKLRNLSWASIVLHLVLAIIGTLLSICFLCIPQSQYDEEMMHNKNFFLVLFICVLLYCMVLIGCTITLIVGLKKQRLELFRPYIFTVWLGVGLLVGVSIRMFIRGIRRNDPLGELGLDLLGGLVVAAIFGATFVPVFLYYKQLKSIRAQPEQHGLSNNQPVNKPYFVQGGQI